MKNATLGNRPITHAAIDPHCRRSASEATSFDLSLFVVGESRAQITAHLVPGQLLRPLEALADLGFPPFHALVLAITLLYLLINVAHTSTSSTPKLNHRLCIRALVNVIRIDRVSDVRGYPWAYVTDRTGTSIGWVFEYYLACG